MPHEFPCNSDKLFGCLACYLVWLYGIQTILFCCTSCETTVHTLHTSVWVYCNSELVFVLHQIGTLLLFLGEVREYSKDCILWLFIFARYFLSALLHVLQFHVHCTCSSIVFYNVFMACILWHFIVSSNLMHKHLCSAITILTSVWFCILNTCVQWSCLASVCWPWWKIHDFPFYDETISEVLCGNLLRRRVQRTCVRGILVGEG